MSIIRTVFVVIIRYGFIGALVAGVAAVCVYFIFSNNHVFTPSGDSEVKAWEEFALMMTGLSGVFGGFVFGAIYGAIRTLMNRKREEKENGKS